MDLGDFLFAVLQSLYILSCAMKEMHFVISSIFIYV